MAIVACNIHSRLQHERREGDTRNPADKANDREDTEEKEHDSTSILLFREVIDSRGESENDIQNARCPDESFGEISSAHEICP